VKTNDMCAIFTGNHLIKLEEVDSTNTYLSNLAAHQKLADGTVVIARYQSAGKGQRGNVWLVDKNKNLTFSILYYPNSVNINKQFLLTQAISLGVYDYLITKCKNTRIKWPNDLYVGNKKIGGLLIENSIKGESIVQVVIGVGLNINQEIFDLPYTKATSLRLEKEEHYDLEIEFTTLLTCIEKRYLQWKNGQYISLNEQYLNVLYLYQSWHIYQLPDSSFLDGKIIGINEIGELLIEDLDTQVRKFGLKEIIF
jgi:BirA family biotin operon repressor/biotin-[acetyl-CoA-carboxylase] ligase